MKPIIELKDFSVKRGDFSLSKWDLQLERGEVLALIGQTGAGKSLLLEAIAGFYPEDQGEILLKGKKLRQVALEKRKIGFVYQDYLLFPHKTVFQNIAYGLKVSREKKSLITRRVMELAQLLSLDKQLAQYPHSLSGGEQQRVALARALAVNPEVLLLDEPFSALDPCTRKGIYKDLPLLHRKIGCAIVLVTHDFHEATRLAQRVAVIHKGQLVGIRPAEKLFEPWKQPEINQFLGL